ncbi:MAG: CPBP family intramembrane glutamic endopeptidase [Bacillota bacterium]
MPKPDDMLEGQNVPENHGKPDTQDRGFKGGSSTDGSLEPSSQAIGPFDAGKAFFLGMFLPDLIAGALVVPESWARVIHILGLPAVAIYLSWSKGLCIKDTFYLRLRWDPDFRYLALLSAGFMSLEILLLEGVNWLTKGKLAEWMELYDVRDHPESFLVRILLTAVLVPIAEELLFRGFSVSAFSGWGQGWAVVFPSIIFALVHPPAMMPGAFVIGVLATMVVLRYNSIVPAVLMHAAANLLPLLAGRLVEMAGVAWAETIAEVALMAIVVSVFMFRRKFSWLWQEFRRMWRQFTEKPQSGMRFKELVRQWPWILMFVFLAANLILIVLIPFVEF